MAGALEQFIQRFAGPGGAPDAGQATQVFDRFMSNHPQDREFDNETMQAAAAEHLGQLPEPQFKQAAQDAYASASPDQQQSLVGTLMRALQSRGIGASSLPNIPGLGNLANLFGHAAPQLDPGQYANLANVVRQQHPEAMQDVVRNHPWFIKAMGNPVVMGALGVAASRIIQNRLGPPTTPRGGGLLGRLF